MNKHLKRCSICGSTKLRPFGSVQRKTSNQKRLKNEPRYKCEKGHTPSKLFKRVCERLVRYLALRLLEKNNSYREVEDKIERFISETGIESTLGKRKYTHTAIMKWQKESVKTGNCRNKKIIQTLESLPGFEYYDERNGTVKTAARGKPYELDIILKDPEFQTAWIAFINTNPVFKILMMDASAYKPKLWIRGMLLHSWYMLEERPYRLKQISDALNSLNSPQRETKDSPRIIAVRQRLCDVLTILRDSRPALLSQQEYLDTLNQQLREAFNASVSRPLTIKVKNRHIYQKLYRELEYGPVVETEDGK